MADSALVDPATTAQAITDATLTGAGKTSSVVRVAAFAHRELALQRRSPQFASRCDSIQM